MGCMASAEWLPESGRSVAPFATVERYFASLPVGWASFPGCVARASLLGALRERGALDALEALPDRLLPRLLLDHLAAGSEWLPEVVHMATLLAVRDARFGAGTAGDEQFQGWLSQLNRDLLDQPENSGAMRVTSASEYLPRLAAVWAMFHIGTPVVVAPRSANRATLTVSHPAVLFPPLAVESRRRAFALALAKQGAAQPNVEVSTLLSGLDARSVFEASWA
jgi:hypothetical protein